MVSRRYGQGLDADAKMFFGLNAALMDASIACWNVKYRYDYARPITVVRHFRRGQLIRAWAGPGRGIQWIPGETWRPYQKPDFLTPPFPEYFSGHSSFSAAAVAFMKDFGAIQARDGDVLGASVNFLPGSSETRATSTRSTAARSSARGPSRSRRSCGRAGRRVMHRAAGVQGSGAWHSRS